MARCLALILSGRLEEARERYRSVTALLGGRDAEASDAEFELAVDNSVVRGMLALYGGERFGSEVTRTLLADLAQLAESPRVDVLTRGHLEHGLCIASNITAEFGAALEHAARARQCFAQSQYMRMFVDVQVGQIAMAQGRVQDAAAHYLGAERVAKKNYHARCRAGGDLQGPVAGACAGRQPRCAGRGAGPCSRSAGDGQLALLGLCGGRRRGGRVEASGRGCRGRAGDRGRNAGLRGGKPRLPALVRYVSALRVSLLAAAGRIGDGEEAWALDDLPEEAEDCLDLTGQSWREMEALSCARLRFDDRARAL